MASHKRCKGAIVRGEPSAQLLADLCWLLLRWENVASVILLPDALARRAAAGLSTAVQPNVAG